MTFSFEFRAGLERLLNRHNIDHECVTPDFILVDLVCDFLQSQAFFVLQREQWFGRGPTVVQPPLSEPPDTTYHQ